MMFEAKNSDMRLCKALIIGIAGQFTLMACAESIQEAVHDTKHIEQQMDFIQSDEINRFIIVMKNDSDRQRHADNLKALTSALTQEKAQVVESLDGDRILMVISSKEVISAAARKTGLIESVTLDQALAPNVPVHGQD